MPHPVVALAEHLAADLSRGLSLRDRGERLNEVIGAMGSAPRDALDAGVRALVPTMGERDPYAGGLAALAIGCLVEAGADPTLPFAALFAGLVTTFRSAARFAASAKAALHDDAGEDRPVSAPLLDNHVECATIGERLVAGAFLEEVAGRDRDGARAWDRLDDWLRPAIAIVTRDGALLTRARADADLRHALLALELVDPMSFSSIMGNTRTGSRLRELLALEQLAFVAVHVGTRRAFRVCATNVTDGGQLHALLAAELVARGIPGSPPSADDLAVFRGDGPQRTDRITRPTWAVYPWNAIRNDGSLPPPTLGTTVESDLPQTVPLLDGEHLLFIGGEPDPIQNWRTQRSFDGLRASLEVTELAAEEGAKRLARAQAAVAK